MMRKQLLILILAAWPALPGDLTFTIAGLRVVPDRWDKQANLAKLEHYGRKAASLGAQVVITPEGFLEGYVANIKANKNLTREKYFAVGEKIDGALLGQARSLARELKIYLVLGFAESRDKKMYNSAVILSPEGDILLRYSKTHTQANDEPFNAKGRELPVVTTPLGRWGS